MIIRIKKIHVLILIIFTVLLNAVSFGYGYFDNLSLNDVGNLITIGNWTTNTGDDSIGTSITTYIDTAIAADPNSPLQDIYDQSGNLSKVTVTIEDITMYGIVWDIFGIGTSTPSTTLGYVSLINRVEDGAGTPIHDIVPDAPTTTLPYPEYNYFTAYDVKNTATNNELSIRLNYGVTMTTDTIISNMTQVSFYASIGLIDTGDAISLVSRPFFVQVSEDGINWTQIGTASPQIPSSNEYAFNFYSYNIPSQLLNKDLFLRISFQGEAFKNGKVRSMSRLVIDEISITTGN